ncbi:hypothetical protein CL657_02945 [bacterium]|nr:hypothetical protein [bacterium]
MTFPIEPIINNMSQFNNNHQVVTQELSDAQTFIKAFSQRLRCFAKSSQTFEASQSVQALYEQLLTQLHVFDHFKNDLAWLLICQQPSSAIQETQTHSNQALPLLGAVRECYQQVHDIGTESLQDLILSIKGALHLVQQYSAVISQRHTLGGDNQTQVLPSYNETTSSTHYQSHRVIDFLRINPYFTQEVTAVSSDIKPNSDGSINLSSIKEFIVDSLFQQDQNQDVFIECPVMFTECPQGTTMAILYDSTRINSIQDLFEYPKKHYCFSVLAADHVLNSGGDHPLSREHVDSKLLIQLDSFEVKEVSSNNHDVLFYEKKINDYCDQLDLKTTDLLGLFDDMVAETLPLHQSLDRLVSFIYGTNDKLDDTVFDFESLSNRLNAMKQFHLALEYQKDGIFESIGYSDLLGQMVHSIGLLYSELSDSYEKNASMLLALHETGLDGLARDLQDIIIEASEYFPNHNDIYGELYDLHLTIKKLVFQLEYRLSIYRKRLERLLQIATPNSLESQLIKECEIIILRLSQRLASESSES